MSLFLLFLFVHGGLRQRIRAPGLNPVMKGIYLLVTVGSTYIMGLMHNSILTHELFPIWAYSIIYVYGGVDTMTAYDLSDNEQAIQYWLHITPLFFWATWLYDNAAGETALLVPFQVLNFMAGWNTTETLQAFYAASKSKGFPEAIWPVVRYMREGRDVPNEEDEPNPVVIRGYRYLVWDDKPAEDKCWNSSCLGSKNNDIVTTEDIWNSKGRLLQSNGTCAGTEHLKDTCLSFALSKLLLTRFAGFTLDESSKQNTRKFIEMELLSKDPEPCQFNRVFRIIEVELEFVFDFFYTKLYVLSTKNSLYKLRRLCCIFLFLWFAFYTLNHDNPKDKNLSITYHGHGLEVGVTRVFAVIVAILEIWQLSMHMLSNWKIVKLLCEYVKEPYSKKGKWKEKEIQCIWTARNCLSKQKFLRFCFKPWQRKLGQYSLIQSYYKVSIGRRLMKVISRIMDGLVKVPRIGQTGDFCVTLSEQVKQAIVSSLINNGLALSLGIATLQRNELLSQLSFACQLETNSDVILVWHIATSACGFSAPQHKDE